MFHKTDTCIWVLNLNILTLNMQSILKHYHLHTHRYRNKILTLQSEFHANNGVDNHAECT